MPLRYTLTLAALLALPVAAQSPTPGTCDLGTATGALDVSDVHATLFNTGSLFFGNGEEAAYLVPKLTARSPIYAAGLWVGGYVGGELRVAGATYADFEFWPGPLDPATGRPPDPDDCSAYDRIWTVSVRDVEQYEATGVASPDLADWPVALGAEVVDGDGVPGNYNLAGGDRPRIYGSQTAFWVMNDVGNVHDRSLSPPIGLEVRVHAFSVASAEAALNRATIYRYTFVNRNALPLTDAYLSLYVDTDLGDASDDYLGSDTRRGMGYAYNADNSDGNGSPPSYGTPPPAIGFDLLNGLGAFRWPIKSASQPLGSPLGAAQMYQAMQGRWNDGTPITEGGVGYQSGGPVTRYHFPGDPVTGSFWSDRCPNQPCGPAHQPSDRYLLISSPVLTLAPGEARTFDVALLFGQGADHLASVTALRQASDRVQQAYDSGALYATAPPPATLPAPALAYPFPGQNVMSAFPVDLHWEGVPGAEGYVAEAWDAADPATRRTYLTTEPAATLDGCGRPNRPVVCAWRVRADAPSAGAVGVYSAVRTFNAHAFQAGLLDGGGGILEVARPGGPVCPDPDDYGCAAYGGEGNSVFRDPTLAADYFVSSTASSSFSVGSPYALLNTTEFNPDRGFARAASPDDYEVRFTEAGGYAVYNAFLGDSLLRRITRVPFEVWNVGTTPADPSDDVRMIPVLRRNTAAGPYLAAWADRFTSRQPGLTAGDSVGVTEQLAAFFPDRPDGYARFEADAVAFGGAGGIWNPAADGDTQVDMNPTNGQPCSRQDYYIAFCARNDRYEPPGGNAALSAAFVQLLFADLAGDGTTPAAGTTVRLKMARYAPVAAEPGVPGGEAPAVAVEAVWPNPARAAAAVRYVLPAAGWARVVVYDVLGRAVAVLAEGPASAGRHEAALDAGRLAAGVYVVAVEVADGRAARTFTVLR